MKSILVYLVLPLIIKAYELDKVPGIEEQVNQIVLDRYNNTYVKTGGDRNMSLYKLDDENNIAFKTDLPFVGFLKQNHEGNLFLVKKHDPDDPLHPIGFLALNSTKMKILLEYNDNKSDDRSCKYGGFGSFGNFLDRDGNMYVEEAKGVAMIKHGQDSLTAIANLEGIPFCQSLEDSDGNVFLGNDKYGVYMIPNEAKELPVPYGEIVPGFQNMETRFYYGYENNVFVIYENETSATVEVKKLRRISSDLLLSVSQVTFSYCFSSRHRFYLVVKDVNTGEKYIYIFKQDGQIIKSETVLGKEAGFPKDEKVEFDDDDNLYVVSYVGGNYTVMLIEKDQTEFKYLNFTTERLINYIESDEDQNLWIVSNHLYVFLKNTEEVVQVSDLELHVNESGDLLQYKEVFHEMFAGTKSGLYTCKTK